MHILIIANKSNMDDKLCLMNKIIVALKLFLNMHILIIATKTNIDDKLCLNNSQTFMNI